MNDRLREQWFPTLLHHAAVPSYARISFLIFETVWLERCILNQKYVVERGIFPTAESIMTDCVI